MTLPNFLRKNKILRSKCLFFSMQLKRIMGDSKFTDDDDSVYKGHVLYIVPGDPHCVKLEAYLNTHAVGNDVWIQNARDIPRERRPPGLNGVPILVQKDKQVAHSGDNIYRYLAEWQHEDSFNLQPANGFSDVTGFDYENFDDGQNVNAGFAGTNQIGTYDIVGDNAAGSSNNARPTNTVPGASSSVKNSRMKRAEDESRSKTTDLISQRQEMDRQIQARNQSMGAIRR